MGYKAAARVLQQADDLKLKVNQNYDLLNDTDAWIHQQKLQTIYHQVLILDLEYALDKKVEQDLWNIGFKNHISCLQEMARNKKNPKRSDCQALLISCLEAASGFYLTLLQELCITFDIDLPFCRRGNVYGQITNVERAILPQTSSCLYMCQYCLVHLGDIARYRNQRGQAENFYKQAIQVSQTSGQPYNQLALLRASQGDKLSTVYYYMRGIAVKNPFPASATNLMSTLSSIIDNEGPIEKIQTKLTVKEFIHLFLCTHGYLYAASDSYQAEFGVKSLNATMTALVATQSLNKEELIKITVINLYSLKHLLGEGTFVYENLTEDEKKSFDLILELIAGSLSAFLVPVHTLKLDETLLDYYALPAVKLLMNFIQNESAVFNNKIFTKCLQIWPSLCKLLNNVQKYLNAFNFTKYAKTPLPEDRVFQGFLLFAKSFKEFNFKEELDNVRIERLIRLKRIMDFSLWLTEFNMNGNNLIKKSEVNGELNFEPGVIQPDPTNHILEEMQTFNVEMKKSQSKSNESSEKKAGILKPQGSLEKSREETSANLKADSLKTKRGKQNVALQSIFKKLEENKQVKFNVENGKEKSVKFETKPIQKQQTVQPNPIQLRTQTFTQSHLPYQINQNRTEINIEQPNMFPYQDMSKSLMPNYQNIQQHNPNLQMKTNGTQNQFNVPQSSSLYQSMPYPTFNTTWSNRDDVQAQNPPFWRSNPPPAIPNFPPPPRVEMTPSYNYSSNLPFVPQPDFSKPPPSTVNQNVGDMGLNTWSSFQRMNLMGDSYDNGQSISMRQAMLNEANMPGAATHNASMNRANPSMTDSFKQQIHPPQKQMESQQQNSPAYSAPVYSLFNRNSWNPNIPGRNATSLSDTNTNISSQSLFSGQSGPQSLSQLLEQQSQLCKKK